MKIKLEELAELRKKGLSELDIAHKLKVTQKSVHMALERCKEKGLLKEEDIGTEILEFDLTPVDGESKIYDGDPEKGGKLLFYYKNGKWHDANEGKPKSGTHYEKKGTLKNSRCILCRFPLYEVEDILFTGYPELSEKLKESGYNYVCLRCMRAYERTPKEDLLKDGVCPICERGLVLLTHEDEKVGYYCFECGIMYSEDELREAGYEGEEIEK